MLINSGVHPHGCYGSKASRSFHRNETFVHSQPLAERASARPSQEFQKNLIALIPQLRAFSRVLCGRKQIAEDVAQEALVRAWRSHSQFEPGTNLRAWLFMILRNEFYSTLRRDRHDSSWKPEHDDMIAAPRHEQEWALNLSDTARALNTLPVTQREALVLVGASGVSYQDAAKICGTAVGTVKSRVARARAALVDILDNGRPLPRRGNSQAVGSSSNMLAQLSGMSHTAPHAMHA